MLKKILIAVVVVVLALLAYAATKPNSFRVERSAVMKAPAAKVFAQVNDLRRWQAWSPWLKLDPAAKLSYSGLASGKGAVHSWAGNRKIGAGQMEITESVSAQKIVFKLDFSKPFKATHMAEFTFAPQGDSTQVTWVTYGPMTYFCKVMSVFASMDKMIGQHFEDGLAKLKSITEK